MSPFLVMEVLEEAQAMQGRGIDVVHLEVGEPDFGLPEPIVRAATEAYGAGHTHYTHSLGHPDLRRALSSFYRSEYGVDVSPNRFVITSGSSPAILMVLMILCEAGSEVLVSNPGYPCYRNFVLACNAQPVSVPLRPENGFQFEMKDIRAAITPRTRALFVNSPMNPTGTLIDESVFKELAQLPIPVISDEIYHGLVYEGRAHSILEYRDDAFVIGGFSKRFAMTGSRLGYVIAPEQYIRKLQILQQNLFICAPSVAQQAGIAALEQAGNDVARMREIYDERRRYMVQRVRDLGLVLHAEPKGAFYVFADARRYTSDSYAFAFDVLRKAHVGVTPGTDFGSAGEGFIRFSYASSMENIQKGLNRLEEYLSRL